MGFFPWDPCVWGLGDTGTETERPVVCKLGAWGRPGPALTEGGRGGRVLTMLGFLGSVTSSS